MCATSAIAFKLLGLQPAIYSFPSLIHVSRSARRTARSSFPRKGQDPPRNVGRKNQWRMLQLPPPASDAELELGFPGAFDRQYTMGTSTADTAITAQT